MFASSSSLVLASSPLFNELVSIITYFMDWKERKSRRKLNFETL